MKKWLLMVLVAVIVSGCSDEIEDAKGSNKPQGNGNETVEKPSSEENGESTEGGTAEKGAWIEKFEEAPQVTMSPEYLANQPQGPLGSFSYNREPEAYEDFFKEMAVIPADASEEELDQVFNYIVNQVSVDLTDPQTIIDTWKVGSFGNPELEDTRYHFKDNYNIEIILDSSGSMANVMNGKTRMDIAKEAIHQFLKDTPENAKVALRVYGHKGTGKDSDKKLSCDSSELVYKFSSYNEAEFSKSLNSFQPAGWTPLAQSLKDAENDLKSFKGSNNTNMIYVVSDGIETCDGNPVDVAKNLGSSDLQPIINIIGFDVDSDGQRQLKEMASASNGTYTSVYNSDQLKSEFDKAKEALEKWDKWKGDAEFDAARESDKRYLDTNALDNEYTLTLEKEKNNLYFLIRELGQKNIVTEEQKVYLDAKRTELEKAMDEAKESILVELKELDTKTLEETKKQIQEKYNQNTK